MLLKVGELAKRCGLTVRTLHHYDEIGLLKPSGRSQAGYRLYSQDDVARLHCVQALRQLGLALEDIGAMLDDAGTSPALIIEQQVHALERQIAQAMQLRERLGIMQAALSHGGQPDMSAWLDTLALMGTYRKYFNAAELKIILANWKLIEAHWQPLLLAVQEAMDRGAAADSLEVQPLAQRWMNLMLRWMEGRFDLIERWSDMYDVEASAHQWRGAPHREMVAFIRRAIDLRMELISRYLAPSEMRGFFDVPDGEWQAIGAQVRTLVDAGESPHSEPSQAVVRQWLALLDKVVGGQPGVREKLMLAYDREPLLRAASRLEPDLGVFLRRGLDPHAA